MQGDLDALRRHTRSAIMTNRSSSSEDQGRSEENDSLDRVRDDSEGALPEEQHDQRTVKRLQQEV